MIVVVVTPTRIVISGHATDKAACAVVSTVAGMLREDRATLWRWRNPSKGPSVAVFRRRHDALDRRAVHALAEAAREYHRHVELAQE